VFIRSLGQVPCILIGIGFRSRRAQLHPELALWLGSIGGHDELTERGGSEEAEEKEEEEAGREGRSE